jgi:broad specificity phosphatase PhoE
MSRMFLIRHGQASFLEQNYDKLSALGATQARLLGEYCAHRRLQFDRVFSGPRIRQQETARIASEACRHAGLSWPETTVMKEFDEYSGESVMDATLPTLAQQDLSVRKLRDAFMNAGSTQEKHKTFQRLFEVVIGKWAAGELHVENVEAWPKFASRVQRGLSQIADSSKSGEQVAVISSGGPIGVTMQRALDLTPEKTLQAAWMALNCSYSEFLFSGERFTLSSFNAVPHLDRPELLTYR